MDTLGLSTSFGIGSTRILAKMGSEENKQEEYTEHFPMKLELSFENRPVERCPVLVQKPQHVWPSGE